MVVRQRDQLVGKMLYPSGPTPADVTHVMKNYVIDGVQEFQLFSQQGLLPETVAAVKESGAPIRLIDLGDDSNWFSGFVQS